MRQYFSNRRFRPEVLGEEAGFGNRKNKIALFETFGAAATKAT